MKQPGNDTADVVLRKLDEQYQKYKYMELNLVQKKMRFGPLRSFLVTCCSMSALFAVRIALNEKAASRARLATCYWCIAFCSVFTKCQYSFQFGNEASSLDSLG